MVEDARSPEGFPLSVIVPTGDRVDTIKDCLESLRWADELIVVDSFSQDGTLQIAAKYADKVLRHEYACSAEQKNWVIPQASHEWILIVDTDERVSTDLRREIRQVLSSPSPYVGFKIARLNFGFGKPIYGAGYHPDFQIRLFRRDSGRYEPRRVHAHVILDGPCGTLQSPLIHYAHRSLDQTLEGLLCQMTRWEAEQREIEALGGNHKHGSLMWGQLVFRPLAAFWLRYVRGAGWRDGLHGLVVSLLWSMYVSLTSMRMWERSLGLEKDWWGIDWQRREGISG